MTNIEKMGEVVIPTLFIIIPVFGATFSLIKVLIRKAVLLKQQGKSRSFDVVILAKLSLLLFLILSGLFIVISSTIIFWFPAYPVPIHIRKTLIFFLLLYWVCFFILCGLSRAVAAGAGSATGILNEFFEIVSNSSDKSKDEKKHNK